MLTAAAYLGASYYFSSECLTVDVYQILVDRGWRRYVPHLPAFSFHPASPTRPIPATDLACQIRHHLLQARRPATMLSTLHNSVSIVVHCIYPLLTWNSLPAASFKPSKDQRKAVNHWNDHVLGQDYTKEASKRYPLSKECVNVSL